MELEMFSTSNRTGICTFNCSTPGEWLEFATLIR